MKIITRLRITTVLATIAVITILGMIPFSLWFVNVVGLNLARDANGNLAWKAYVMPLFLLFVVLFFYTVP